MTTDNSFKIYLRILGYLRKYWRHVILVIIFNFFFVIFNMFSVWIVAPFISTLFESEQMVVEQQTEQENENDEQVSILNLNEWLKLNTSTFIEQDTRIDTLKMLCIVIFITFLFKNIFKFGEFYWVSYAEQRVIKDIRDQAYSSLLRKPLRFFSKYNTGELISRTTNDINILNNVVNKSFTKIIRDPFIILLFMLLLFNISWQLTLISSLVIPLSALLIRKIGESLKRKSFRVQEKLSEMTSIIQEAISGIKIVKSFSMEGYEKNKFKNKTLDHFRASIRQVRLNRLAAPVAEIISIGIIVVVLWFGGQLVLQGQLLSSEDFIRFMILLYASMDPIKTLSQLNNEIQIAVAAGSRVFDVMDSPVELDEPVDSIAVKEFNNKIVFENVSFKYSSGEDWILKNVNLTVEKNQKVALTGSSGGGKTTLVNLLPRFYDVTNGNIKIDGIDLRNIKFESLRSLIGLVTQEIILFNDTIAKNIAYGIEEYSFEELKHSAKLANAFDFIMQLPQKFDTVIGEKGMRLSGGQRQRISIARAIFKNPPILIFDEATSSLDSESESLIQVAIDNLMKNRTVFIIAHRLSSVISSDKIAVIENGEIIGEGNHKELLKDSERYRQLYELQFKI